MSDVREVDQGNALAVIAGQLTQLKQQFPLAINLPLPSNVVLVGMGGSALPGEFIKCWLRDDLQVPFEIVRDYNLPAWVGENTLVIASSYSGDTEEALSALEDAKGRNAKVVILASGGDLEKVAEREQIPMLKVPAALQPRLAVFFALKALATLLESVGLVSGATAELEEAGEWLIKEIASWSKDKSVANNPAKQLAQDLQGHVVVVYGSTQMAPAVLKWKIDLNENAKNLAFYYLWPEFKHNEFQGWLHPEQPKLKVVQIKSSFDHPRVVKSYDIVSRLLAGHMPKPLVVEAKGETKIQQILWTTLLGDFVSVYLAFLNRVDPLPVDLVEELKKELG